MTYSTDFRRKVLAVRNKEGLSIRVTAQRFDVGVATVTRWRARIEPQPVQTRQRKLDKPALLDDVKREPHAYHYERAARFGVSPKAIWQALKKLGVTYKKKPASPQSGPRRTACLPAENSSPPRRQQSHRFCG
jgi:transposase